MIIIIIIIIIIRVFVVRLWTQVKQQKQQALKAKLQ